MENIELKNELNEKLESELKAFMEDLKLKSPEQIMDNSYKLVCMTEIKDYLLYEKNCSNFELKTLLDYYRMNYSNNEQAIPSDLIKRYNTNNDKIIR